MRDAVIVSTARTPIGKAYRGAFNDTSAQELAGHAVKNAIERAGVDAAEIQDVVIGAALQQFFFDTVIASVDMINPVDHRLFASHESRKHQAGGSS